VDPDLFITIAFVSLVVGFAIGGLFVALHERRRHAAASRTRETTGPVRGGYGHGAGR